jgi:hypothetical protein
MLKEYQGKEDTYNDQPYYSLFNSTFRTEIFYRCLLIHAKSSFRALPAISFQRVEIEYKDFLFTFRTIYRFSNHFITCFYLCITGSISGTSSSKYTTTNRQGIPAFYYITLVFTGDKADTLQAAKNSTIQKYIHDIFQNYQ